MKNQGLEPLQEWLRFVKVAVGDPVAYGTLFPVGEGATRRIVDMAEVEVGDVVVDVGAGHGNVSEALIALEARPRRIVAVERSAKMRGLYRERFRGRGDPRLTLISGDARFLPGLLSGLSGPVDRVVSTLPVSRLHDSSGIFSAIAQALRPGGTFVQITSDPFHCMKRMSRAGFHVEAFRMEMHGFYPLFVFKARKT